MHITPEVIAKLLQFRQDRDWQNTTKNLAIAISIEASELLECLQWLDDDQIKTYLSSKQRVELEDEIADVAIYLTYLCHDLGVDLNQLVSNKMEKNAKKYPIDEKGKSHTS